MNAFSEEVAKYSHTLTDLSDLDELIDVIKDKKIVMLGESSHGTSEFYNWRKVISLELLQKHHFDFIAVEGDWPPCQKLNQFIHARDEHSPSEVLKVFDRWPTWLWANMEMEDFLFELKLLNNELDKKIGFHGLDVYSFMDSIHEFKNLASQIDMSILEKSKNLFSCFEKHNFDEKEYARSLFLSPEGCEKEVDECLENILNYKLLDNSKKDLLFDAIQNAHIIKNAESYYRAMISIDDNSWNIRDRHMLDTMAMLLDYYGKSSKGIIWAHNTHIGDYRGTDMALRGQVNLGGLAKEQYGDENVSLIGFGTYSGSVVASHAWDGPVQILPIPEARQQSLEFIMHNLTSKIGSKNFFVLLDRVPDNSSLLEFKGHRAIGVVYHPESDRRGNYVPTSLAKRYDAFIFIDETHALSPFKVSHDHKKFPESFPFGSRI